MGKNSSFAKPKLRKGLWSPEEDEKLLRHITLYGHGCWSSVPKLAGLQRCGKSCRLRWINYLRPDVKRGTFSPEEERLIIELHAKLGNRWSQIAAQLPGRTDNEIKNFWNSSIKKKLRQVGIDPVTHKRVPSEAEGRVAAAEFGTLSTDNSMAFADEIFNDCVREGVVDTNDGFPLEASHASLDGISCESLETSLLWHNSNGNSNRNSSRAFDISSGISSIFCAPTGMFPITSQHLSESHAPLASVATCCGGSSNSSEITGNSSASCGGGGVEMQSNGSVLNVGAFSWPEIHTESLAFHVEGEPEEFKWPELLQTPAAFPSNSAVSSSSYQNDTHDLLFDDELKSDTQVALNGLSNWKQTFECHKDDPTLHDSFTDFSNISAAFSQM